VIELEDADLGVSGTLHRQLIAETPEGSEEFARGVIWANYNKFPTVYPVVDMAVFNHNPKTGYKELLVIEKGHMSGYMLPGGFCDVGSPTDEHDASREVLEETGIIVNDKNWEYLKSLRITSDWRYRDEVDEMRTRLYATVMTSAPTPVAGDDAATAKFVPFHSLSEDKFNITHRVFFSTLLNYYNKIAKRF
jgi:bifunctional NMN adenylyltransferase/nudix hydrolase